MLEYLKLENVGPAPYMEVEFAPRVNLITGDNGLGKSFLLDTAWWALTEYWPAEVNRRMTSGLVARPRDRSEHSSLGFRATYSDEAVKSSVGYSLGGEAWMPRMWQRIDALIVYAHADGSFSVWDSVRNNWPRSAPPVNPERRPPYVFTETEVWDGLAAEVDGRTIPLCNGLLQTGRVGSRPKTPCRKPWPWHCVPCHPIGPAATGWSRDLPCGCRSMMREISRPSGRVTPEPSRFCMRRRGFVESWRSPTC